MLVKVHRPTRILAEEGLHVVNAQEALRLVQLGAAVLVEEEPTIPAEAPQKPAKEATQPSEQAPKPAKKKAPAKKKKPARKEA